MADAKTSLGGIRGSLEKEQDAALKVAGFFTKVKRFFGLDKRKISGRRLIQIIRK